MTSDDLSQLSFEQAMAELDAVIARLEAGDVELDEAITCYERGVRLAQRCTELLDRTEQRVTQLVTGPTGRLEERPLEVSAPSFELAPETRGAAAVAGDASPPANRPLVPPPPSAPVRARSVPADLPPTGLLPVDAPDDPRRDHSDDIPF